MWRVGWLPRAGFLLLASCGRIGFAELSATNGDGSTGDAASTGFSSLSVYADQTCALFGGAAYCWGRNSTFQLGDETMIDAVAPTRVQVPSPVTAIVQGDSHGCAIVAGDVYCWGTVGGQIPFKYNIPAATAISAGNNLACVVADVTRCWGTNDVGQLGNGNMATQTTPVPVAFSAGYIPTQIEVGDDHACALAPGFAPMCWGHNDSGALGFGSMTPTQQLTPVNVTGGIMSLPHIAGWHACALDAGTVRCWGEGVSGELGDGLNTSSANPVLVAGLTNVTAVETGGGPTDHDASCAIVDGAVSCWGRGTAGRLGTGNTTDQSTPKPVVGLPARALSVALGYAHGCALLVDGDIWCWGRGDRGQLGDGKKASSLAPVKVVRPTM